MAGRMLATTLLGEVAGTPAVNPKRQDKMDKKLAKAMQHYRKAWQHADKASQEALKKKGKG